MAVNYQVHKLVELKGRRGMKVVDYSNPDAYLRLTAKDQGIVYIQKGKIMYEDGQKIPVNQIPEWVLTEIKKCSPEALREVGFAFEPILKELDAAAKAKSKVRVDAKKEQARKLRMAQAKKAQKGKKAADRLPDDEPEPEDVGLEPEAEEDAAEEDVGLEPEAEEDAAE